MQGRNEATAPDPGACLRGLTLHSVEVLRLSEGPFAERELKCGEKLPYPASGKEKGQPEKVARFERDGRGWVSYSRGMPTWTYDDLQDQIVEFRFGPDPEFRLGRFVISKNLDGSLVIKINLFLPDPYNPHGGLERLLELSQYHVERIRPHPQGEHGDPSTPKFLLLA